MMEFRTVKEAKGFLASRIAAEADRAGQPLSEVERKMLYFSETDWTLPEMTTVSAEFDRNYDQNEYEQKIARLVRKIEARNQTHNQDEERDWNDAVLKLSEGDNYLSVLITMVREAPVVRHGFIPTLNPPAERAPHDRLRLWLTAFAIVFGVFAFVILGNWLLGSRFWSVAGWIFNRNRFGLILIVAVVVWVFRFQLKDLVGAVLNRKDHITR